MRERERERERERGLPQRAAAFCADKRCDDGYEYIEVVKLARKNADQGLCRLIELNGAFVTCVNSNKFLKVCRMDAPMSQDVLLR